MRFGVVVFPGTWSDADFFYVITELLRRPAEYVWHRDTDISRFDCLILPGGFAHGDYLRAGAIAGRSPVVGALGEYVAKGGLVMGSCNGFQILCEAGLLPGALMRNHCLQYRCQWVHLRVENADTPFTRSMRPGQVIRMPISHGDGRYTADPDTLRKLNERRQVVFRYSNEAGEVTQEANPNGSLEGIAGVINAGGTILGLMPHPERAMEEKLGGTDGLLMFYSLLGNLVEVGSFQGLAR